jgi:hypothetical protein
MAFAGIDPTGRRADSMQRGDHPIRRQSNERSRPMFVDTQPLLRANDLGVLSSALVVVMAILAMLGVITHAASL